MARAVRNDRSSLLYPELRPPAAPTRKDRYLSILCLRGARAAYHSLAAAGEVNGAEAATIRGQLRAVGAALGFRLVIAAAAEEGRGRSLIFPALDRPESARE